MNEPTPQLNLALAKAKSQFDQVLASQRVDFKTKAGGQIRFNYADHEEIAEAVTPALSANGLAIVSQMLFLESAFVLCTTLRHESGEAIASYFPLPQVGADPKEFGSTLSYGRRYNLLCLLEVAVVDPKDETQRAEQVRKLAKEVKQQAGLIKKPEPVARIGDYKPTGLPTGYKSPTQEEIKEAQAQTFNGLYPKNNKIVTLLLDRLEFSQSRFDGWYNQKFPGCAIDMLDSEQIYGVVRSMCKSYAQEHSNTSAANAIEKWIIEHMKAGTDLSRALNSWLETFFSKSENRQLAKV